MRSRLARGRCRGGRPAAGDRRTAAGRGRAADHEEAALPGDGRAVGAAGPGAGCLRLSRPCRRAGQGGSHQGQQPPAALAAGTAGPHRELADLPGHRHRLRELAVADDDPLAVLPVHRRTSSRSSTTTRWWRCIWRRARIIDERMVYWDIRPSTHLPTVEVRVSDVPLTIDETVLLATLIRALVMTALARTARRARPWSLRYCGPRTGWPRATAVTGNGLDVLTRRTDCR